MMKQSGVFSQRIFHPKIFDTGGYGSRQKVTKQQELEFDLDKLQMLREDSEIIPILIAISSEI